ACRAPGLQHIVRHREGVLRNAELFLGGLQLIGAERFAMGLRRARLVRRAIADGGLAGDQRWLAGLLRARDCRRNRLGILAVDALGRPARRLATLHLIYAARGRTRAVDGTRGVVLGP